MDIIEIAKQAHRAVCPMINCVDCLFGVCDNNCEYQSQFEQELENIIKYEQRNDNQCTLQEM